MKKLFAILGVFFISVPFFNVEGKYVLPASMDEKGTLEKYFYAKGYAIEQTEGDMFKQLEIAIKYGVRWVPVHNFEVYIDPPLVRYHTGGGSVACAGIGDMDIGMKFGFTKGIGGQAFVRIPTGAYDLPKWDNFAPPFSNKARTKGGGVKLLFSQELFKGLNIHLNLGYLYGIGDIESKDNPIPWDRRIPFGVGITLPHGIFIEGETDINAYSDAIEITKNPKRIVTGINYEWLQGIKFLAAVEYGTWGTGDPVIHRWNYGWGENVKQWDITLGVSSPITFPTKSAVIAGAIEGTITDRVTGEPIEAKIMFPKAKLSTITCKDGKYTIILPTGKYAIAINVIGYETYTTEIEVLSGKTTKKDFRLTH